MLHQGGGVGCDPGDVDGRLLDVEDQNEGVVRNVFGEQQKHMLGHHALACQGLQLLDLVVELGHLLTGGHSGDGLALQTDKAAVGLLYAVTQLQGWGHGSSQADEDNEEHQQQVEGPPLARALPAGGFSIPCKQNVLPSAGLLGPDFWPVGG